MMVCARTGVEKARLSLCEHNHVTYLSKHYFRHQKRWHNQVGVGIEWGAVVDQYTISRGITCGSYIKIILSTSKNFMY